MKEIVQIEINSKLDSINKIEDIIDDIKKRYHLQEIIYGNIMVASIEAVTNAIEHGNNCDINKKVNFSAYINQKSIKICIKDEGIGFDVAKLADPTLAENKLEEDGRGVFLMKNLSDSIEFDDNGTCIQMFFNF